MSAKIVGSIKAASQELRLTGHNGLQRLKPEPPPPPPQPNTPAPVQQQHAFHAGTIITVQVPAGVPAGGLILVNTASGSMQLQVPAGLVAGQTFQAQLPVQPMVVEPAQVVIGGGYPMAQPVVPMAQPVVPMAQPVVSMAQLVVPKTVVPSASAIAGEYYIRVAEEKRNSMGLI